VGGGLGGEGKCYVVLSPRDIVIVKPRDRRDHVAWLVERKRYEEALEELEKIQGSGGTLVADGENAVDAVEIGHRYIEHLVGEGKFLDLGRCFFEFSLIVVCVTRCIRESCTIMSQGLCTGPQTLGRLDMGVCAEAAPSGSCSDAILLIVGELLNLRFVGIDYHTICTHRVAKAEPSSVRDDAGTFPQS
jgi:hypothetical protein